MQAEVLRAINVQINSEFAAWYQYLAMSAFCAREQFTGAAKWLQAQSVEEYQHGMKLYNFVLARNGVIELSRIEEPVREFDSFGEVFERAYQQEMRVTEQINGLYELCFRSKAFAEMTELQWFLTEQLEEVSSMDHLLKILERAGDDLLQADEYLARVGVRAIPEPAKD